MYKFNLDGSIEASTLEEALQLRDALARRQAGGASQVPPKAPVAVPARPSVEDTAGMAPVAVAEDEGWEAFIAALSGPHQKLETPRNILGLIHAHRQSPMERSVVTELLGMDAQTLGGHLSGLRRRAQTAGLDPDLVFTLARTGEILPGRLLRENELPGW